MRVAPRARGQARTAVTTAVLGAAWAAAVCWQPGLPGGGTAGLDRQSSLLIAVASILAALVVLMLTLGSIALQVLSEFSWQLTRTVVGKWLAAGLAFSVIGGVILPLWMTTDPDAARTRVAFTTAGWSALILMSSALTVASRINPVALADRTCERAGRLLSDGHGPIDEDPGLLWAADALAELVASRALPSVWLRKAVVMYSAVLAVRSQATHDLDEIEARIRGLADLARENIASLHARTVVIALGALGVETPAWYVHDTIRTGLSGIAQRARAGGVPGLADEALDALADMVDVRMSRLLPVHRILAQGEEEEQSLGKSMGASVNYRRELQALVAASQGDDVTARELAAAFTALRRGPAGEEAMPPRSISSVVLEMLEDTVATLRALLASPSPDSAAWPSGWQGIGVFDRDVERIAKLAGRAYARGQYPETSVVEETLEEIGSLLRHETMRQTDYPEDRTGWRDPWRQRDTPVTAVLAAQVKLMDRAFEACFDRRALLTGRRILASATVSAEADDRSRLQAAVKAMESVVFGTMARDRYTDAGHHRNGALLTGLMTEADSLYACAENPACRESIEDVAYKFMWLTDVGYEVPIACWETELRGLGWPDRPSARSAEAVDGEPAVMHRLSARLVAQAQKIVTDAPDPSWTAAAVTSLWAHAAGNLPEDNGYEARRLAAFLTGPAHENRAWRNEALPTSWPATPAIRQLGRLIAAVVAWSENGDLSAPLDIPAPSQPESLTDTARRLADDPRRPDVVYRGLFIDDASVVVVDEKDGSQRLLRDAEACARNRFTWGYQGTGPHRLAEILLSDVLGSHLRCPACLGAARSGAGVVRCATCRNRGVREDMEQGETALVRTLLSKLPQHCCWKLTGKTILTHLAGR